MSSSIKAEVTLSEAGKKLVELAATEKHCEYGGFKSNHAIHGIVALYALGADDKRVQQWYDSYKQKLEPRRNDAKQLNVDKLDSFGTETFDTYFAFFEQQMKQGKSLEDLVSEYVPKLLPGMWKGALHPVISLGYALQTKNDIAGIYGLAYWAASFEIFDDSIQIQCAPVSETASSGSSGDKNSKRTGISAEKLDDLSDDLFKFENSGFESSSQMVSQKGKESIEVGEKVGIWKILKDMREEAGSALQSGTETSRKFTERLLGVRDNATLRTAHHRAYSRVQAHLNSQHPDSASMLRWTNGAVFAIFRANNCKEFFLLHSITGLHALRFIAPLIKGEEERRKAVLLFNFVMLAVYLAEGAPHTDGFKIEYDTESVNESQIESWEAGRWKKVIEATHDYKDEHVLKLVQTAKWNFDHEDNIRLKELFLICAEQMLDRVDREGNGYTFRPTFEH